MTEEAKYEVAKLLAGYFNKAEKNPEWEGIVFIPYETKHGKCVTPCPYGQKTPAQKLDVYFREAGLDFGGNEDDCAMVGSQGCGCCWYNCGHSKANGNVLLCGKEARLTTISKENEEQWRIVHDLKFPRRLEE